MPAVTQQSLLALHIPFHIPFKFSFPIFHIDGGHGRVFTTKVAVPKTPMHKNNCAVLRENNIRIAG